MTEKIKIGVSSCLLGLSVRYDGGHKHDRFITDTLGRYMEFVPVCPEVESGFKVPRLPFHLEGHPETPHLLITKTREDVTEIMKNWAAGKIQVLEKENLCGFIFKSKSPSSGMERVKVYNEKKIPRKAGVGIFAKAFMDAFPLLPVEDEGRLHDPGLRENFIERIFALKRWREMLSKKRSLKDLVDYHTSNKLLILSHSPEYYRKMGKLVADGKQYPIEKLFENYEIFLLRGLKFKATIKKNVNVLHHILGYFKKVLSPDEKKEVLEILERYQNGYLPLIVPVTLMNHFVRKYDQPYLQKQTYLNPHPLDLKLRNHV